ncbi:YbaN family protein [Clostridium sp. NSJ-49]|uniref:Putative membrane protein STY0526 n=1 Tax=Clostridium disporicum TaxID=84024 RepID=A0A174JCW7_9CLOT|nr:MULTISPECIES: YbaN family protein [Clostridium]MBC5624785.1 YbaN family protein [Clostridium sp. NSJ-49]MCD2502473.1 YbaN family protein [Clostridium sp. NSJ-145]MDU6341396.1 YbaN family protein [Clostridium sp.]CUO96461.1 putative membrane protein STY0526 [Clostridium disporicum]
MNKIKKYIYITVGLIAFALGAIGVALPILPTTPFLLLASFCFARGSEKFNIWFTNTKVYKKHLESFVNERAMTLKQKVCLLAFADFMLAFPMILIDNLHLRIFLVCLILFKLYYFTFRIKTIKPQVEKVN